IVVGHHPVYSASSNVSYRYNPYLESDLVPIMERHGVQVYFAGHDHNLQHLWPEGSPVHYFISGGGSLTRALGDVHPDALFALRVPGFMAVSITARQLFVQAIDEHGHVFYFTNVPVGDRADPAGTAPVSASPAGSGTGGSAPEAPSAPE